MSATIERTSVREPRSRHDFRPAATPESARSGAARPRWQVVLVRTTIALAALAVVTVAVRYLLSSTGKTEGLVLYTVRNQDLPIAVTERGNLESQSDVQVICEVDDVNSDGINGTLIVWIVPNGSSVKKGELLVELDTSSHMERLDRQILATERAQAEQIQAEAKYENQITQNETAKADAALKVRLAELELLMFSDQENGTHQLEVEEIKRSIDDINSEILAAQANLELKQNDKQGIEALFKLGYAGKNELDRSRLEHLQAEGQFAAKMNRLRTEMATLAKKETYERDMQLLQLQGSLDTARRMLVQVERDNEANLAQAKAAMDSANESLKKEQELLARYREQVEKGKIYAPQDGMVAYATDRREEIREGVPVRPRQVIMTLPSLDQMQVKTAVHESVLDQIKEGLKATIKVDAFPDRSYAGTVQTVAVLPDQSGWMSSDTKVYTTIVTIDQAVQQLKPGMTAVVEIHVDTLKNVLAVPVQAILQEGSDSWLYVQDANQHAQRRSVELGRTNDKFVEIKSGIAAGDNIVLNPLAIVDQQRKSEGASPDPLDDAAEDIEPSSSGSPGSPTPTNAAG